MKRLFVFLMVIACIELRSQVVTIIDQVSREALPGVLIHDPSTGRHTTTNVKGQADISALVGADSLRFSYITYRTVSLGRQQLLEAKKIELVPGDVALLEVVVSANRWEEQASETPNRIEKITKREVELQNPQTTADLLESSGYVYVQKSQMAGGSPMLRGFATNRVMLVVDGVRMNNAIFRSGNLQNVISVDANAIESAEVLFGPGAVMYGSDAIGGVMDFHTLAPRFSDSTGKTFVTGNMMARLSSANNETTIHADVTVAEDRWSSLTSFSRSQYGDLLAGSDGDPYFLRPNYVQVRDQGDTMITNANPSLQVGTAFAQTNFMQKFLFKAGKNAGIDYALHYSESSNAPRYDRLVLYEGNNDSILDHGLWYYGPQKWMMNRLGLAHEGSRTLYDKARVIAAWQMFGESRNDRKFNNPIMAMSNPDFDNPELRTQTERVDAFSLNIDLDKRLAPKFDLYYGAEAVLNRINSEAHLMNFYTKARRPTNTRYPDNSTWMAFGVYGNLRYKISPKLIMNAGIRYSYYRIRAKFDTLMFPLPFDKAENRNGALNGAAGLSVLPDIRTRLYLNASTGFRAPNIDDIGKVFESEPGSVVVPNNRLNPEYAYNAEAGLVKVIGRHVKVDAAAYYTLLTNALARRPYTFNGQDSIIYDGSLSKVQAVQNISSAYVYGIQAGIEVSTSFGLGFSSKISYQKGEEQSEDSLIYYPKPHVAPLFGRTDITYTRKNLVIDLYTVYNGTLAYEDLSLTDRIDNSPFAKTPDGLPYVPAWYTLNAKIAWYINRNISVTVGAENITDVLYRPFSSGISAPGRNFIVSLRARL